MICCNRLVLFHMERVVHLLPYLDDCRPAQLRGNPGDRPNSRPLKRVFISPVTEKGLRAAKDTQQKWWSGVVWCGVVWCVVWSEVVWCGGKEACLRRKGWSGAGDGGGLVSERDPCGR